MSKQRSFGDIMMVVDTQEKTPLIFTRCPSVVASLPTGDYTVRGFESHLCIERKSLPDLVASVCSKQRERFEAELHRAQAYRWRYLVIESTLARVYNGEYRSKAHPEAVMGSLLAFSARYGICPIFAGNPEHAAKIVEHLALVCVKELETFVETLGYSK